MAASRWLAVSRLAWSCAVCSSRGPASMPSSFASTAARLACAWRSWAWKSVGSSLARIWPASAVSPTLTLISATLPEFLKFRGTALAAATGPVAAIVSASSVRCTGAVTYC